MSAFIPFPLNIRVQIAQVFLLQQNGRKKKNRYACDKSDLCSLLVQSAGDQRMDPLLAGRDDGYVKGV